MKARGRQENTCAKGAPELVRRQTSGDPSPSRGQGGREWPSGLGGGCSGGGDGGRPEEWLLRPGRAPHYPGMRPRDQWVVITQAGCRERRRRRLQDSGGGAGSGFPHPLPGGRGR